MLNKKHCLIFLLGLAAILTGPVIAQNTVAPLEGKTSSSTLDLLKVFLGSPIIYSVLFTMSILSFIIWLYSFLTLRISDMMPTEFIKKVKNEILEKRFEAALATCRQDCNFAANILACGLASRKHGPQVIMDSMQAEGRRSGSSIWQRISILNDVAIIAPMLGLLGTVLGMFYAFYDTSRTPETITSIFDGLGIAVGTTVAGLIVAIVAMIFHTTLKFRIVRLLSIVENEVLSLSSIIELENKESEKH